MMHICPSCGEYTPERAISPDGGSMTCPICGRVMPLMRAPIFIITGACGAGKSTISAALYGTTRDYIVMESDILWRNEFNQSLREYREIWLRVCKNISQSGIPVALCGCAMPGEFEACVESRYFSAVHYLAAVCDDDILAARLKARPAFRQTTDAFIASNLDFNAKLKACAGITALDNSHMSVSDAAAFTDAWIRARM